MLVDAAGPAGEVITPEPIVWSQWWAERKIGLPPNPISEVVELSPLRRQMLEGKARKAARRAGGH
jgi:hypothetical protein